MKDDVLLTFNSGSSTLKIGVFEIVDREAKSSGRAKIDFDNFPLALVGEIAGERVATPLVSSDGQDVGEVVRQVFEYAADCLGGSIVAAAHRIVHGGLRFQGPALLDDRCIDEIEGLVPLAPLHQPAALRFIRAVRTVEPALVQTASFDTAFHSSQEDVVRRLAIPRALHDDGIRRYGFHGISYAYVARKLSEIDEEAGRGRTVVAHLGSGASLCGMMAGVSRDTSMGFSALDGVPMATRPGWIDPGVLLYLMRKGMRQPERIEDFLYHECGLLGVSGISGDTRVLVVDQRVEAQQAIDLFCLRVAGEIARQAVTLGGLEAVVFTAGVGENQPEIRARVASRLQWLGVELDASRNEARSHVVSTTSSRVKVFVIPTNEEQVIADEALSVLTRHRL